MTRHDFSLTLGRVHVVAICVDCGETRRGAVHVGSMDVGGACTGKADTTHEWTIGADVETALAACSWCGTIRTSAIADGLGYSPHLDLSGNCPAVVAVPA